MCQKSRIQYLVLLFDIIFLLAFWVGTKTQGKLLVFFAVCRRIKSKRTQIERAANVLQNRLTRGALENDEEKRKKAARASAKSKKKLCMCVRVSVWVWRVRRCVCERAGMQM